MENKSGQLVTFYLNEELFGIELDYVKEIIRLPDMVRVPGTPPYFSGLANLRGVLLPVIDGRRRFNLPEAEPTEATRVIVLEFGGETVGYVVDRMSEVINLESAAEEEIQSGGTREGLISKVVKTDKKMVMVVNIEALFLSSRGEDESVRLRRTTSVGGIGGGSEAVAKEELKQFVGFKLADEEYAVAIEAVQEIVWVPEKISRSPGFPPYVDGLFFLRSRTIPMLNMRSYFLLPEHPYDERSRVLVLNISGPSGERIFGMGVDAVTEVLRFTEGEIEPLPKFLGGETVKNLTGVCKLEGGNRLIYLLDPSTLLEGEEEIVLAAAEGSDEAEAKEQKGEVENQFVLFHLAEEDYALNIQNVQEIIRVPDVVRVPRAPSYVEGVINIRGNVLPVINLRSKLGLPASSYDDRTRIVVVDIDGTVTGLVVDAVREVKKISASQIAESPRMLKDHLATNYLQGVVKQEDGRRSILLLNLNNVLSEVERSNLHEITEIAENVGEEWEADVTSD